MTEEYQQELHLEDGSANTDPKPKPAARKTAAKKAARKRAPSKASRTEQRSGDEQTKDQAEGAKADQGELLTQAESKGKEAESPMTPPARAISAPVESVPTHYSSDDDPDWNADRPNRSDDGSASEESRASDRSDRVNGSSNGVREQRDLDERQNARSDTADTDQPRTHAEKRLDNQQSIANQQRNGHGDDRPESDGESSSNLRDEDQHQDMNRLQNKQGGSWKQKRGFGKKFKKPHGGSGQPQGGQQQHAHGGQQRPPQHGQQGGRPWGPQNQQSQKKKKKSGRDRDSFYGPDTGPEIEVGALHTFEMLSDIPEMERIAGEHEDGGSPVSLNELSCLPLLELVARARDEFDLEQNSAPRRQALIEDILRKAFEDRRPLLVEGIIETTEDGYGLIVYQHDNYKVRPLNAFVSEPLMRRYGLKRGATVTAHVHPSRENESCPFALRITSIMGEDPLANLSITPFEDLVPFYPTKRLILETSNDAKWDNLSMRVVDLLTPIGMGQRGLIVAPPRTGKTILQQGIANAIAKNNPEAHLIVLLVDERPEEVTDFRRQVKNGEVIASTFDQDAESHVHCAEMVIEKARRMVEKGRHVVILLDSITRLARAYNALASNSGKILSGGVEANALQKPKRFFGSARNIEGGGSITILGTALVDTGSRMDEVIFEEFKGTGNMELHLDRALVDKRIFPSISLEKSGTRKEELLYHPDEMQKVYGLRRAMKGVPSTEAMEMLITRVKKTRSNIEFLVGLNR